MEIRSVKTQYGVVFAAIAGLLMMAAGPAGAQQQAAEISPAAQSASKENDSSSKLEEVVVTGTSIRGTAPVGANLITVNKEAIAETGAQTMQQILASVPAVTGFGNAAQGGFGSADLSGTYAPTIHGLGASASNGTLVLIDGRRLPLSGINHTLADPNIIAPLSIERVEVLPDGASSTYGSDAVAGVINFITRRNFKGLEVSGQAGLADNYNTEQAGLLWGDTWDRTSVMISYDYERRSALNNADRSFTRANQTGRGGGDFATFNCGPASARYGGNYYLYPYNGAAVSSPPRRARGAPCRTGGAGTAAATAAPTSPAATRDRSLEMTSDTQHCPPDPSPPPLGVNGLLSARAGQRDHLPCSRKKP